MDTTGEQIKGHLLDQLKAEDPNIKIIIVRTSLGWLRIKVITKCFEDQSLQEREEKIDNVLSDINFNLGQYPISSYELLTPQEAKDKSPKYKLQQLPLWSDILMAPEPEQLATIDEDTPKSPLLVTFYSFKGGVGRSTALGIVSGILAARKRRVVVIDFDLEAPGISILFRPDLDDFNQTQYGVLDYLHQRHLTPDKNFPAIEDCICKVNLLTRGELFLVPAGEYNEDYIHRLAELDRGTLQSFYRGDKNPIHQLIEDIKKQLNPDVILIDARPGFNDTSAITLFDIADTAILCFSPTDQSFEGLRWVVKALRKQRDCKGKPDVRFLLTPLPPVTAEQRQTWLSQVEEWIEENWGLPNGTTIEELYDPVSYNPNIITLSSLANNVPQSILDDYLSIANKIDASLPEPKLNIGIPKISDRKTILNQLEFEAVTAQEMAADRIPDIFQRTENFSSFIKPNMWLIRGAKGTGKSLLFRLFVEQSESAKELAKPYEEDLSSVTFVAGHGQPKLPGIILVQNDLKIYEEQVGEDEWQIFWLNYNLLRLCYSIPELRQIPKMDEQLIDLSSENNPQQSPIVSWLVERAKSLETHPQAADELRAIDRWLQDNKRKVWLLYDGLDTGFGSVKSDYSRRKRAVEALLSWWLETGTSFQQIVPKIFLREDIWNRLNFNNKGHFYGHSLELIWKELDLWRLVLRQALKSSKKLDEDLDNQLGLTVERLEKNNLEQLRKSLYPLWGERMGRSKKAYTYNWVRTRTADSQGNSFPRSLILLLKQAVEQEKNFSTEYNPDIILRPKALIEAFPEVSRQRVVEVRNEYPELEELLNKLENQRSPIDEQLLESIWEIQGSELNSRIKEMIDAGIFKERPRSEFTASRNYSVAELYLYGLNMVRKGQR